MHDYIIAAVLLLLILHVAFLIAISYRLAKIGYSGGVILRIVVMALGCWPLVFVIGAAFDMKVMHYYTGVPVIIGVNCIVYFIMELRVLLENGDDRLKREGERKEEDARHQEKLDAEVVTIEGMVPIKSYVGDNAQLSAISDLGRLRDAGLVCRIEGSLVKTIFVDQAHASRASDLIGGGHDVPEDG